MLLFICVIFNFFVQCLIIFWVQAITFLVQFITWYFFGAVVNGIFFLISLSDSSLFIIAIWRCNQFLKYLFCILLLYWIHLSILGFFGCRIFRVSLYNIMSFPDSDSFASSFLVWMPFISSSCLIVVARTSNTMLNRSGESGYPCLVPDHRGKVFSVCLLSMMLALCWVFLS